MCSKQVNIDKPHSADYFTEARNFWWNLDFMQLMVKRLQLENVKKVLDVGCGVGHWGRVLSKVLTNDVHITGIDREQIWVQKATDIAANQGISNHCHYQIGDALNIPFPDNSFDMVTCQTLLIHLQNPHDALKEFIRVLKPQGILLLAEPNSAPLALWANNVATELDLNTFVKLMRFQHLCETGKHLAGEGWNSAGEFIAGYLATLEVQDIQVYLSDKCNSLFPPYSQTTEQKIISQEMIKDHEGNDSWIWDLNTTKRYYSIAIKKAQPHFSEAEMEKDFKENWQLVMQVGKNIQHAVKVKTLSTAGGAVMYLTSARKK